MRISTDITSTVDIVLEDLARVDDPMRLYANARLAKYCEPYVPMQTGLLVGSARITPEAVTYPGPYAHYQYEGIVYGPNFPIKENGIAVGFFSIPDMPKSPTGRQLNYRRDFHPQATSKWDKAAMAVKKKDLAEDIKNYILKDKK